MKLFGIMDRSHIFDEHFAFYSKLVSFLEQFTVLVFCLQLLCMLSNVSVRDNSTPTESRGVILVGMPSRHCLQKRSVNTECIFFGNKTTFVYSYQSEVIFFCGKYEGALKESCTHAALLILRKSQNTSLQNNQQDLVLIIFI